MGGIAVNRARRRGFPVNPDRRLVVDPCTVIPGQRGWA